MLCVFASFFGTLSLVVMCVDFKCTQLNSTEKPSHFSFHFISFRTFCVVFFLCCSSLLLFVYIKHREQTVLKILCTYTLTAYAHRDARHFQHAQQIHAHDEKVIAFDINVCESPLNTLFHLSHSHTMPAAISLKVINIFCACTYTSAHSAHINIHTHTRTGRSQSAAAR